MHELKVVFETQRGTHHAVNQDSLFSDPSLGLFIVADGMSGHSAGEVASSESRQTHSRAHPGPDLP